MKKSITLFALLITLFTFAQVPQGISYQAIALNAGGNPVISSNVRVRLSILDVSATGTTLYSETQLKTTNAQGLFNLVIGQGTVVSGVFNTINWGTNSKFLKVEMDATGGTTYVLVGTTQLLSVPYALAADSLVTSPGEGITLVSPNGTPYQVTVNDSGQLSLPTSNATTSSPFNFYMYGTFNSYNPTSSLLMANYTQGGSSAKFGYKYLTAGTELKFLGANNASSPVYGIDNTNNLIVNGNSYLINSNGYYYIELLSYDTPSFSLNSYNLTVASIAPYLDTNGSPITSTYSSTTNKFTFIANGISTTGIGSFRFYFPSAQGPYFGDNLADGTIDSNGNNITFPNLTSTPKNFRVELTLNFNGSGNYTITQIP
jgi:hypothetical protein